MKKAGFSLLEVILALAILAGAIAVLGEASRQALRNAAVARDLGRAQMLCETKLAEITTGMTAAEPIAKGTFDAASTPLDPNEPAWVYSIETNQVDEAGLLSVRVTVTRDLPAEQHPVHFSLVCWLPDPNATSSSGTDSASTANINSTSGTGNGGSF